MRGLGHPPLALPLGLPKLATLAAAAVAHNGPACLHRSKRKPHSATRLPCPAMEHSAQQLPWEPPLQRQVLSNRANHKDRWRQACCAPHQVPPGLHQDLCAAGWLLLARCGSAYLPPAVQAASTTSSKTGQTTHCYGQSTCLGRPRALLHNLCKVHPNASRTCTKRKSLQPLAWAERHNVLSSPNPLRRHPNHQVKCKRNAITVRHLPGQSATTCSAPPICSGGTRTTRLSAAHTASLAASLAPGALLSYKYSLPCSGVAGAKSSVEQVAHGHKISATASHASTVGLGNMKHRSATGAHGQKMPTCLQPSGTHTLSTYCCPTPLSHLVQHSVAGAPAGTCVADAAPRQHFD